MKSDQGSDEVVKQVHMYIIIHITLLGYLLYNNYAGIIEYPLYLADWQLVYVVSTQSVL